MLAPTDSDTLELLADAARSIAAPDPDRVRRNRDAGGHVDRAMWSRLAEAGWLSILVPEDDGGAGLHADAVVVVARQLGFAAALEPFIAAGVLAPAILVRSSHPQRSELLDSLSDGSTLFGVGWQPTLTARTTGSQTLLDGACRFLGVAAADRYLLAADGDDGVGLYLVDGDAVEESIEHGADGSASAALTLAGIPADPLVAAPEASDVLTDALDLSRVASAGELLGLMDRVLELTLEHLRQRRQFDRPIGAFQVLQHRAVDAWIQRQLTDAALQSALRVLLDPQSNWARRAAAASSVKARAALAAPAVCGAALQLHGAIGFTDEYDLGLYLNRALTIAPWLGGAAEHRLRHLELTEEITR